MVLNSAAAERERLLALLGMILSGQQLKVFDALEERLNE
jgi:hypothetical protein